MRIKKGYEELSALCEKKPTEQHVKSSFILFITIALSIGHATASELIFSCITDNGKLIKVIKDGAQDEYIIKTIN